MSFNIAPYIDHTLLKADATSQAIEKLCKEALQFQFFGVCVNSSYVSLCRSLVMNSKVKVVTVVGFPLGAMSITGKAKEVEVALRDGADEIDTVIHVGRLKSGDISYVKKDLQVTLDACDGKPLKVIIETSLLSQEEKKLACEIARDVGVQFVKTSTGFNGGGATVADVSLMKSIVGPDIQVKASGGIRDMDSAMAMIHAGATRLGTSSGVLLVQGQKSDGGY